jgi:hypothetical protein
MAPRNTFFYSSEGFLTCRKILRHGTSGFTSRPKEGVLGIFIALKNPSSLPVLNPRTLCPIAGTLVITPQRTSPINPTDCAVLASALIGKKNCERRRCWSGDIVSLTFLCLRTCPHYLEGGHRHLHLHEIRSLLKWRESSVCACEMRDVWNIASHSVLQMFCGFRCQNRIVQ